MYIVSEVKIVLNVKTVMIVIIVKIVEIALHVKAVPTVLDVKAAMVVICALDVQIFLVLNIDITISSSQKKK